MTAHPDDSPAVQTVKTIPASVEYESTPAVSQAIAELGRTEDIRFSPAGNLLAISTFASHKIALFKIDTGISPAGVTISIKDFVLFSSPDIERPHGVAFLDEQTLLVANRFQFVSVFRLPDFQSPKKHLVLNSDKVIRWRRFRKLNSPGSVDSYPVGENEYRLLICDNFGHAVTTVNLTTGNRLRTRNSKILLKKGLHIPDGVSVSANREWFAISNHTPGTVFVYANTDGLNRKSEPAAILRGMDCPHGLRFARHDRTIVVADAARPFVYVYTTGENGWSGDYEPTRVVRVLNDELFQLGRHNKQEGGPKGIDIDRQADVLAVTCEHKPLTFYPLQSILQEPLC
jgi:hypothetical protein